MWLVGHREKEEYCMSDIEQAQSLLRIAQRDLNALLGMLGSTLFADEIFGFHAQQAVEKALKAWLCSKNILYPLTHDLPRLLALLAQTGVDIECYRSLDIYTVYGVEARYAEGEPDEPPINRNLAIERIGQLLEHVGRIVAESVTR